MAAAEVKPRVQGPRGTGVRGQSVRFQGLSSLPKSRVRGIQGLGHFSGQIHLAWASSCGGRDMSGIAHRARAGSKVQQRSSRRGSVVNEPD